MTTNEEAVKSPLWWAIEESLFALEGGITEENKEEAIQKIAGELDEKGYNVSSYGGRMLSLRWAMEGMVSAGKPMLKDFYDSLATFKLEDLDNACHASYKLTDDLGGAWKEIKLTDRRAKIVEIFEKTRLDILVKEAKTKDGDLGIRLLIEKEIESSLIIENMGITQEKLDQVNADIAAEIALRNKVVTLLEKVADKPDDEKVKYLFDNDITEELIIEVAKIDQASIDKAKKALEEELKEKQRLAEEAAAKKKAEAEGPALEDITPEDMANHIYAIREIMEFSDVEKEIRVMCEQSAVPKALVDIAVSDPAKLDELESQLEG